MEHFSTLSEGKCEDFSGFSQSSYARIDDTQQKRKRQVLSLRNTTLAESRMKTLKNFKMHSTIKPKEQKITSIFIKSKYWKRKKFLAVSPHASEIQIRDRLVIFNNEQIETCYHDLQPERILSLSRDINRVVSVQKDKTNRVLEMNLSSPYENKQHTFKFLIDHFRKVQDPLYQNLYVELHKYQKLVSSMYFRLHNISKQIGQKESYHNEVVSSSNSILDEIKQKVFQWCSQNQQNSYYFYKIQKVNYESKTCELVSQGMSYDLLSLIGQDEEKIENTPLYTYNNLLSILKQYDGQQRIITQTRLLEAMNSCSTDIKEVKTILQTIDSIDIICTADVHFIYPQQVPNWMGKQDINAQIWSFSMNQNQIEQVHELRVKSASSCEYTTSDNIEYSISRDLFFSKFYPSINNHCL